MTWDYRAEEYEKQATADECWHLERLINYGLGNEKLRRESLDPAKTEHTRRETCIFGTPVMGEEILRAWQKTAIEYVFAQPDAAGFYLTGGTALAAYYLKHRVSDDLDFFSEHDFPTTSVQRIASG